MFLFVFQLTIESVKRYVMSVPHDEGVGPETRHIAINFRGRSTAQAIAIRQYPLEGRSHLFSGSDCDFADQVGADRQNRPSNKVLKCAIYATRGGAAGDSR